LRPEMKRYRDAYENKFWQGTGIDDTMIRVETSDCYSFVEGFISSLFTKNPAVVVSRDVANPSGNHQLAQEAANRFLFDQRGQIEIASRLALIYPQSFLKISPRESTDLLEKVAIRALPPWEVFVDLDACDWDTQRFCGHFYYLPLNEAKEKYGNKRWQPQAKHNYFDVNGRGYGESLDALPEEYQYVKIVEMYDMLYDRLYIYTPNLQGDGILSKDEIPLRTYDDKPLSPIAPLYYSKKPEKPLCGISAVSRVYDQFYEKNVLRTYWANAIRRDSRQYLYREGAIDEEALAKITAGIDGAMIPVDEPSLAGVIQQVGVEPISSNFDRYLGQIEGDINRGTILAPFSRGETTGVTATEISALAQYSASQLGKLARERDSAIERLALIYLRVVSLLAEDGEQAVIEVNQLPKVITVDDLDAKFRIIALDQASTPISNEVKKRSLLEVFPLLQQMGVPQDKIKEELVRIYDLPQSFLEGEEPEEAPPQVEAPSPQEGSALGGISPEMLAAGGLLRRITMKFAYHRCPQCYWTVKTSSDFEKVVECPYDHQSMTRFDRELSIFINREDHLKSGLPGFYSYALGRIVESEEREEEIMREKGFVRESKLNEKHGRRDYVDHTMSLAKAREDEIRRLTNIYKDALAEGKTEEEAVALAFSAEDALSGKLQQLFNPKGETNA